jgi:glucarate dehydratase
VPATTIAAIRATPVTVPLEAPLLHSNGAHWGRFVRTIVEVETADGYVGLGEMGGGGEDAARQFAALADYLRGHDVFRLEALRFAICNPTASLYNNRTQLHAAIEFACLDIMGQKLGVPVHALLGGKLHDEWSSRAISSSVTTIPSVVAAKCAQPNSWSPMPARSRHTRVSRAQAERRRLSARPRARCYRALAAALDGDRFRYDPNSALSLADAIDFGRGILDLCERLLRGSVWGMPQLARAQGIRPIAHRDEHRHRQLRATRGQRKLRAVDVVLLDTTFWGGIRPCIKAPLSARRSASASRCTARASSGSSSRRCCIWALCCRISVMRPTRTITTLPTTSSPAAGCPIATEQSKFPMARARRLRSIAPSSRNTMSSIRDLGGYP